MLDLKTLKKGMLDVLRDLYPSGYRFYGIEVTEGYEKPSFFTQLIPVMIEREMQRTTDNIFLFVVTLFQKEPDEADALEKITEIRDAYGAKVHIGDRYINVTDFSYEFIGEDRNIPQIQITVSFKDQIMRKEEQEAMRHVEWRYENE